MNIIPDASKDQLTKEQIEYLQKKKHELKLIGKQRKVPGHILWSYNIKTGEIKPAAIDKLVSISMTKEPCFETKVTIEADCIYLQALNKKIYLKNCQSCKQ